MEEPIDIALTVRDLDDAQLGEARITELDDQGRPAAGVVTIDDDAYGMGWYSGFGEDVPEDRYDLYSVMLHEVGHVLGFTQAYLGFANMVESGIDGSLTFAGAGIRATLSADAQHLAADAYADDLMDSLLSPGVRELPSKVDVRILQAAFESVADGDENEIGVQLTTLNELDAVFENWDTPDIMEQP